jgi:hypothetical protein
MLFQHNKRYILTKNSKFEIPTASYRYYREALSLKNTTIFVQYRNYLSLHFHSSWLYEGRFLGSQKTYWIKRRKSTAVMWPGNHTHVQLMYKTIYFGFTIPPRDAAAVNSGRNTCIQCHILSFFLNRDLLTGKYNSLIIKCRAITSMC